MLYFVTPDAEAEIQCCVREGHEIDIIYIIDIIDIIDKYKYIFLQVAQSFRCRNGI